MIEKSRREYLLHRIASKSSPAGGGCLEWVGARSKRGYGLIRFSLEAGDRCKPPQTAHRAHYMAHYDVVLEKWQRVGHRCGNPSCVAIGHLFVERGDV